LLPFLTETNEMTELKISLDDDAERRLTQAAKIQGLPVQDFVSNALEAAVQACGVARSPASPTGEESRLIEREQTQRSKNRRALALVRGWLSEEPTDEDERWTELQQALEANHSSDRRLFSN